MEVEEVEEGDSASSTWPTYLQNLLIWHYFYFFTKQKSSNKQGAEEARVGVSWCVLVLIMSVKL